jgi:hypothetical protein
VCACVCTHVSMVTHIQAKLKVTAATETLQDDFSEGHWG